MPARTSFLAAPLALLLGACGGATDGAQTGDGAGTGPAAPSAEVRADIEATITEYFGAETAEDVCAVVTRGFEVMVAEGSPPPDPTAPPSDDCPAVIEEAVERDAFILEAPARLEVEEILVERDRAGARVLNASISADPYAVFLYDVEGRWLVASDAAVLPGFGNLAEELES